AVNGNVKVAAASLSRNAALKADGKFEAATLKLIAPLIGTRAVVDGRASLAVAASGTVGAPVITGTLAATDLRVDSPQYSVLLREGVLRADLTPSALKLAELRMRGGGSTLSPAGTLSRQRQAATPRGRGAG